MTAKWIPPDLDHLIELYRSGTSEKALAETHNISRGAIRRVLLEAGIQPRNRSQEMQARMAVTTPEERSRLAAAAHEARRGQIATPQQKIARAHSNELTGRHISELERYLAMLLAERGVQTVAQKAIGPYNCDLAAKPVAVEVFGGKWHFHGDHLARAQERFRYILDAGWHVLIVIVTDEHPLTPHGADHITALINAADGDPSAVREYRMVGGSGEDLLREGADLDELTVIYPRRRTRDPGTGRYQGIPR